MWVEQITEGPRHARIRLDQAPWSLEKVVRRGSKHALWLGWAFLTGFTFVGYFTPIRALAIDVATLNVDLGAAAWIVFFTLATYINAGWMREQVCIYMCPYARFQSAMFDKDTLIVSYDAARGDPRGARKRGAHPDELGDCIDCQLCVQVCPTGIDIRDGLQYQCIGCAHCIDACDDVMRKGRLRTRTDPLHHAQCAARPAVARAAPARDRICRRVVADGGCVHVSRLFNRSLVGIDVIRDRGELFHVDRDAIRNDYTLKVMNKTQRAQTLRAVACGRCASRLTFEGPARSIVDAGDVANVPVSLAHRRLETRVRLFRRALPGVRPRRPLRHRKQRLLRPDAMKDADERCTQPHVRPWYRQFWPWFLIAIPLAGVVMATITATFAYRDRRRRGARGRRFCRSTRRTGNRIDERHRRNVAGQRCNSASATIPDFVDLVTHRVAKDRYELELEVPDMRCANCAGRIEQALGATGRREFGAHQSGAASGGARLRPEADRTLARCSTRSSRAGYTPAVRRAISRRSAARARSDDAQLKRLAVAGLAMMQVMMFSLPLYVADTRRHERVLRTLFRWSALRLHRRRSCSIPRGRFSQRRGVDRAYGARRIGGRGAGLAMDVPVALAIAVAYRGERHSNRVRHRRRVLRLGHDVHVPAARRALPRTTDPPPARTLRQLAGAVARNGARAETSTAVERIALDAIRPGDRIVVASGSRIADRRRDRRRRHAGRRIGTDR